MIDPPVQDARYGLLVLAGGEGQRLRPLLGGSPKGILRVRGDQSVLSLLVRRGLAAGLEVCVAVDVRSQEQVRAHLAALGLRPKLAVDSGVGTAPAVSNGLRHMSATTVIVCNADTLIPFDVLTLTRTLPPSDQPIAQVLTPLSVQNEGLIGVGTLSSADLVIHSGEEDGSAPRGSLRKVSASGAYVIDRRFWLAYVNDGWRSLEREVLPRLVAERQVRAYLVDSGLPTYDFGTPDRLRALATDHRLRARLLAAGGHRQQGPVGPGGRHVGA